MLSPLQIFHPGRPSRKLFLIRLHEHVHVRILWDANLIVVHAEISRGVIDLLVLFRILR